MAHYRKIDVRIWNDEKFRRLSNESKLAFFSILTHPALTAIGAMRGTLVGIAAETGISIQGFEEVLAASLALFDAESALIWLPNFMKYNRPDNPNVAKAWGRSLDLLPECDLKESLIAATVRFLKQFPQPFRDAFSQGSARRSPEPFPDGKPNQEQEQEQEQEREEHMHHSGSPHGTPAGASRSNGAYPDEFEVAWRQYPERSGTNSKAEAFEKWRAAVNVGIKAAALQAATVRYAAYCQAEGIVGSEKVMQARRFFAPKNRMWEQTWSALQKQENRKFVA